MAKRINFNKLPLWQHRGIGFYWQPHQKTGTNPLTGETVSTMRHQLKTDLELPMRDEYGAFVQNLIDAATSNSR